MSGVGNDRIRQVVWGRYAGVAHYSETGCRGPSTCCDSPKIDTEGISQAIAARKRGESALDLGSVARPSSATGH